MNGGKPIGGRLAGGARLLTQTGLALVLVVAGTACDRAKAGKDGKAAAPPPPSVIVADVQQHTVAIVRDFVARTQGIPTVDVRARVPGVLEHVRYKEGTEVKQGQILFELQREEYAAALQSAQAQLAKAEADLTRARDASVVDRARAQLEQRRADLEKAKRDVDRYMPLAEARAIPQQDLDTAQSQQKVAAAGVDVAEAALRDTQLLQRTQIQLAEAAVQSAKAAVTQADLNLGYTRIAAPISGIVGKIEVDPGNLVGKNEPTLLTVISAVDPIYAEFTVAEADYLKLASRIRLDAQGRGRDTEPRLELFLADDTLFPHKGRFVFVGRAFEQKTGTINVQAEFPNPTRVVRPGQFARVRGTVDQRPDALLVPALAVQEQQGAKIVLVVDSGDKVAFRPVTLDERVGDLYVVTKGLKAGERVIVEGVQKVRPGMQVKPELKASAGAAPASPAAAPPEKAPATAAPGKAGG
ncbi:MAG TPA: efflux RND transporter periplasmic adaptor subunit [Methylomirabilota bacterium]|nr:efflux RND transporter periplasmic adaptor subunit [Methylomirabilota bacterium]